MIKRLERILNEVIEIRKEIIEDMSINYKVRSATKWFLYEAEIQLTKTIKELQK